MFVIDFVKAERRQFLKNTPFGVLLFTSNFLIFTSVNSPVSLKLIQLMKTLHCQDLGFDCPGIIQADSETEVLRLAAQHALDVHQTTVTPEMAEQIKPLIHEA